MGVAGRGDVVGSACGQRDGDGVSPSPGSSRARAREEMCVSMRAPEVQAGGRDGRFGRER